MYKFKVTNKVTGFVVFHTVSINDEKLAKQFLETFFSNNYSIEKV